MFQNFERVLVQNILYGLPPNVSESIQSIPRWHLVRFALPHVLHCAATMIRQHLKCMPSTDTKGLKKAQQINSTQRPSLKFDQAETKLLYTLQWLLLDAASECADNDPNLKSELISPNLSYQARNKIRTCEIDFRICYFLKKFGLLVYYWITNISWIFRRSTNFRSDFVI